MKIKGAFLSADFAFMPSNASREPASHWRGAEAEAPGAVSLSHGELLANAT